MKISKKLTEYINNPKAGIMDGFSIASPERKSFNTTVPNSLSNSTTLVVLNESSVFLFKQLPRAIYLEYD